MKLSQRERIVAIVTGVALGVLLLDRFILSPVLARIDAAQELIDAEQLKLARAAELASTDLAARRRWRELSGGLLKQDSSSAEGQLLDRVREAASSAGLSVQSLKPDRSEQVSGFSRIVLRVHANGSMGQVGRFLYDLQHARIPLRIVDLQIGSRKDGFDDLSLQVGVATIFEPAPTREGAR